MSTWTHVAIDLGLLCFFGFLYYLWQKKRIIRVSKEYILIDLNEFNLNINEYADEHKDSANYQLLNSFTNKLEDAIKIESLDDVLSLRNAANNCLTQEQNQDFTAICNQIDDLHLVN